MTNNEKLRIIKKSKSIKRQWIADNCAVSVSAVDNWFRKPTDKAYRNMPDSCWELLTMKMVFSCIFESQSAVESHIQSLSD